MAKTIVCLLCLVLTYSVMVKGQGLADRRWRQYGTGHDLLPRLLNVAQPLDSPPQCHLWVDGSGYCRIGWNHIITEPHCRRVVGDARYNTLTRDAPGQPQTPDADGGPPEGK